MEKALVLEPEQLLALYVQEQCKIGMGEQVDYDEYGLRAYEELGWEMCSERWKLYFPGCGKQVTPATTFLHHVYNSASDIRYWIPTGQLILPK